MEPELSEKINERGPPIAPGDDFDGHSQGPLEWFATQATRWAGSSLAFGTATFLLVIWAASGPLFGFSEGWQLIVNTVTTIVTFLMVFLIQRAQNKDSRALHLKLNELLAALDGASNRLLNVEDLSEDQLKTLHRHFATLAQLATKDNELTQSHSVEEAERRHKAKGRGRPKQSISS